MPIEESGGKVQRKPATDSPIVPSMHPVGYKHKLAASAYDCTDNIEPKAVRLEQVLKTGEIWLIWIGIATLLINVFIAYVYWHQLCEMRKATIAATQASQTAADSLKLTRDAFDASQAAVLQPKVSIRDIGNGPFIQIDIFNRGHISATHVSGDIQIPRHTPLQLKDVTVTDKSASPDFPSGFITRTVSLGRHLNMRQLAKQHLRVAVNLSYWNGVREVPSAFCYGLTVSPYSGAQDWQDCENQQALQQNLPWR